MAEADVRLAEPVDAAEIARIQVATWQHAYADLLPRTVLESLNVGELESQWQHTVSHGPASVLVATEGDWLVGFCAAGPAPESETRTADGSLPPDAATVVLVSNLLVEPRWGRRGHGGRLLGSAAQRLRGTGATRGITWIPESDTVSRAFYDVVDWVPDGTVRTLDTGGRPIRELRLSGTLNLHLRPQTA